MYMYMTIFWCFTIFSFPFFSGPIPSALQLVFKAQRLHRNSTIHPPPASVINQLCSTSSQALTVCSQNMSSEDNLNLVSTKRNHCCNIAIYLYLVKH